MGDFILENKADSQHKKDAMESDFFGNGHILTDLKAKSVRGGMVTMLDYGANFVLRTGATVVLARILTPEDYGLISMVTAITAFVMMFRDMGLSTATIQKAEINHSQVSTLFWLNVAVGFGLSVITVGLAPVIAWFYSDQRLIWITLILSSGFLFTGFVVQHQALLRRQMRFGILAVVRIISLVTGIAAAILAAHFGAGYWALVVMQLMIPAGDAVGLWLSCRWRPSWPGRGSGVRSMVYFGLNITGFNIANTFSRNLDNVLIGRCWGPGILGLYSRAYQFLLWPISYIRVPLTLVAIPAMSRLQNDPVRFRMYYAKLVSMLAFVSMPLMIFLAVCSENVVVLLLGEKWLGAGILFKIMALTGFMQTVGTTTGLVQVSHGQAGRYLKWGLISSLFTVASFFIGLPWGATGVACSYAISYYLILFPSLWFCFRFTPVTISVFLKAVWRPAVASVCMGAVVFHCRVLLEGQSNIVLLIGCFVIALTVHSLVMFLIPGGILELKEYFSYVVLLLRRKPSVAKV